MVQLADIALAHDRLARYLQPTPLEDAPGLGAHVWLKLESANRTHSFKVRGALNAMLSLSDEARAPGIVAASSGNHAQGVAYAAHVLGLSARIVMPTHTPKRKVSGAQRYGAEAILHGSTYNEAEAEGRRLERALGLTYVSPYNDAQVIAGAGTVGLEIVERLPEVARVIVPVSGGGLISGIAIAVKSLRPAVEVIGAASVQTAAMYNALHGGNYSETGETLAEALSGGIEAGSITIELVKQTVDRVVLVSEEAIAGAMRWMAFEQGWIVEGGGAVGVAALMSGAVQPVDGLTAVVVSGGNVDAETLTQVLNERRGK